MKRNVEEIKKKQLPTIFSMGFVDLIFQLELTDDDFLNPLSKSINSVNSNANNKYPFEFENIKSIKDLYFLKRKEFIWDKIVLKGGNPTLNQLLIGNEYLENKCIIDYVGYGPLKFIKEEEIFFQKIFNYVTKKNFLHINEKYLDKNSPSTLIIELTYNNNSLIIKYNSQEEKMEEEKEEEEEENEDENNLIENNKKSVIKRNESILYNIEPSINEYNLVFLNYSDIEKIPGDFQMNDLVDLLNFFQKNGSNIFVNFFNQEKENEDDNETESKNENYLQKINEKKMLYDMTNIYFFETLQAQKMFQKHFEYFNDDEKQYNVIIEGDKIFSYFIDNILIVPDKIKMDQKKTSIFLDNFDTLTVISLIKNKSYKKQYNCEIFPELKNNENLNNNDNGNQNNFNENNNDDINKFNKPNENSNNNINNKNDGANENNENSNNDINSISDETDDADIQEQIKEYKEIIEENKIDLYSILISFAIYNFAYNSENFYLFKIVSKPFSEIFKLIKEKIELNKNKKEKLKNVIYLIDTTKSMNKYKDIIYSLEDLNQELINVYGNIKIGYVLYKDYLNENNNILKSGQSHIKIIEPSSELINIQENEDFNFEGGDDFAEDWANPINDISHLNLGTSGNIVIHICDSGAHGHRFSDYCNKNEQENLLIEALNNCQKNKIKIIGLIINELTKKSFSECKKIYKDLKGFYNIVDLKDLFKTNDFDKQKFINIIKENIEYALLNKEDDLNNEIFQDKNELIEEDNFEFDGRNVKMKRLSEIENYKETKFCFLPQIINDEETQALHGIKQGAIGDCYLISSILSMINSFPLIFNYIFPNLDYDEKSKIIQMYVYKNGIKELISFKNTYATSNEKNLLFVKPYNNELYGICLEKGYAISKAENSLQSGYEKIVGGLGYQVFETILGTKSEKYKSSQQFFKDWYYGFKTIDKNKLKDKIKKYIDYGGIITFGVRYSKDSGHHYSLQGYKIDKKENFFVEILNPHRSGKTIQENIYVEKDYNNLTKEEKELFDNKKTPKINENEFKTREEKESLENYTKTGFLFLNFDTFYNWFSNINMCDPMFGSNTYTIEFIPDGSELYTFDFEIDKPNKFKVTLTDETNSTNSKYKIQLSNNKQDLIIDEDNCDLIYEKLEKGLYNLKIMLKGEIKNKIYLKLQCNDKIKINVNQENNNILIIEDD